MYQKNHDFLIDIFDSVHRKNTNAVLVLIGEGELEEKVREKIQRLSLQDSVIFTGSIPNVNEMYQMMDVFLLPSLYEGFPVVGVEAQASGVCCIFSDTITKEIAITDMANFISLSEKTDVWADKILSYSSGYSRKDMTNEIKQSGYSIYTEA